MAASSSVVRPSGRVRWDRVGRVALLLVLVGMAYLYVGPTRSWMKTYHQAKVQRERVDVLKVKEKRLVTRERELRNPAALEKDARKLGMVKPGERAYVIDGLPSR